MKVVESVSTMLLTVLLAACGGGAKAPATTTPPPATMGEAHAHDFPPEVDAFHNLLAPRWHATAGDQRTTDVCSSVASFKEAAAKIDAAPVPPKAAAQEGSWHYAVGQLNMGLHHLESTCGVEGRTDFEIAFKEVHDAFHRLVALVGHEMHEGDDHSGHAGSGK